MRAERLSAGDLDRARNASIRIFSARSRHDRASSEPEAELQIGRRFLSCFFKTFTLSFCHLDLRFRGKCGAVRFASPAVHREFLPAHQGRAGRESGSNRGPASRPRISPELRRKRSACAQSPVGGCIRTTMTTMPDWITQLRILPLTADLWPMFEDLLGRGGPCSRCWCMYWRIGPAYHKRTPRANKSAFQRIVRSGPPPGLIALLNDEAVGWCQLTPRVVLPHLDQVKKCRAVDDQPVWSITCFYVRMGYRKKGVSGALIQAAIKMAKQNRAPALEGYPLDAKLTPSSSSTGYVSAFLRAGFKVVARHFPPQPVMRLDLRGRNAASARSSKSGGHNRG